MILRNPSCHDAHKNEKGLKQYTDSIIAFTFSEHFRAWVAWQTRLLTSGNADDLVHRLSARFLTVWCSQLVFVKDE